MSGPVGDNPYRASGVVAAAGGGGAISWCTTVKTGAFCAEAGSGYIVNTCSTAFTATLPCSPSDGDQISFVDYTGTFDTNNLTLGRGGKKIKGACNCAQLTTERGAVTIIYTGATQGWITTTQANAETMVQAEYLTATGGSPATGAISGDYKIHTFTGDGPFCVATIGNPAGSVSVDYLVVAGGGGGGGGGSRGGGGAGAGGYRESVPSPAAWTASPIASSGGAVPVSVQDYTITVGAGATSSPAIQQGGEGCTSTFSTITSAGGGGGGGESPPGSALGTPGGSGGGGGGNPGPGAAGTGNDPPVSPVQGQPGGTGGTGSPMVSAGGGGGGGATAAGVVAPGVCSLAGDGGAGGTTCISGSPASYGGGGGGGSQFGPICRAGDGGAGGGGDGGTFSPNVCALDGTANSGGGGGGDQNNTPSGGSLGGSGVVLVRYKFQ